VLVAETFQGAERAGVFLVGLKQRLVLDARVAKKGDGEGLGGGAQLGRSLMALESFFELLDEKVHDTVLA
jgi:hypothetical protein